MHVSGVGCKRPMAAVILAGRIRPSPLREAIDVHVLCLPVGAQGTLLDAWMCELAKVPDLLEVRVVVNTAADVDAVSAIAGAYRRGGEGCPVLRIIAEPASWRGAGGILRDVTSELPDDAMVLVCEGKRLPPASLTPLLEVIDGEAGNDIAGVVGVVGKDEPGGVYAFSRRAIDIIPSIGYFDMKEQFLPELSAAGEKVVTAKLDDAAWRLYNLESYLATVRKSLADGSGNRTNIRASDRASISGSAVLDGCCIIEPGAVIEDGAVVHDSVVLWGATIGGGAIVSRSVVGPLAVVEPRARVVQSFVSKPTLRAASAIVNKPQRAGNGHAQAW